MNRRGKNRTSFKEKGRKIVSGYLAAPEPLQRQILQRAGCAALALIIAVALKAAGTGWESFLAFLTVPAFFLGLALHLLIRVSSGGYIVLRGVCTDAEKSRFRLIRAPWLKTVRMEAEGRKIRIRCRKDRSLRAGTGDELTLYILKTTPVGSRDGEICVDSYLALTAAARGKAEKI